MRKSCYDCVRKHLGSAGVFIKETEMGYPDYDIWAIGELEHAADECLRDNYDLAMTIREHRLRWTYDRKWVIPFEDMNRYIKACVLAESSGADIPGVPDELTTGLGIETGSDGTRIYSGDTRP